MNPVNNLKGRVFGDLYVVRRTTSTPDGCATWLCICVCGKMKSYRSNNLVTGNSKNCGCMRGKK